MCDGPAEVMRGANEQWGREVTPTSTEFLFGGSRTTIFYMETAPKKSRASLTKGPSVSVTQSLFVSISVKHACMDGRKEGKQDRFSEHLLCALHQTRHPLILNIPSKYELHQYRQKKKKTRNFNQLASSYPVSKRQT